jgi:hypothetical protein
MWKDDGTRFFGAPYWNNPSIRLIASVGADLGVVDKYETELDQDLISHETLIWAKDATELRQLKRVSIFTTYAGTEFSDEGSDTEPNEGYEICGLGTEFVAEYCEEQRLIGLEGKVMADRLDNSPPLSGPHIPSTSPNTKVIKKKGHGNFRVDLEIDGSGGEIVTEVFVGCGLYEPITGFRVSGPLPSLPGTLLANM